MELEKFEIVKCEPYRFVGGSVYLENKGKFRITNYLWEKSDWIFEMLEDLKEYSTDEIHNAALTTWEKYDDKNELHGYYIGRFMKAETTIPHDLDYFDINEEYMAKGWVKGKLGDGKYGELWSCPKIIKDKINHSGYIDKSGIYAAEVYPKPDKNGESFIRFYHPCSLKNSGK